MGNRQIRKKMYIDNRGASVVAVIVATALIGLFVASVMFTSLYNSQMRAAELVTQDTFYTADLAMEEIRVGLTNYTSDAMAEANVEVLEKYTASTSIDESKVQFSERFLNKLSKALGGSEKATTYDAEVIRGLVSNKNSVRIRALDEGKNNLYRAEDNSSLTLRGVEVEYTNPNGYVSVVSSDITIAVPEYGFATDANLPDLARFSLVGQRGVIVEGRDVKVIGTSVFAGKGNDEQRSNGVGLVLQNASLDLINCPYVVSESKVDIANTSSSTESGNTVQGKADLTVSQGSSVWTTDINVYGTGSSTVLNGTSYVQDDLTVYGKNNSLTLSGQYYGYGKNNQSAILVNGTGAKLDLSRLTTLMLTGNATIGVEAVDYGTTASVLKGEGATDSGEGQGGTDNSRKVPMGESIAAKGGQLAYLAPQEMVGVNKDGSILGINPMPENRYNTFMNDIRSGDAHWIEFDRALPNMGGKTLKDYGVTNGNEVYVYHEKESHYAYVYLKFPDEKQAGAFFRDYYDANHEDMTSYIGKYIDVEALSLNNDLFDATQMGEFRVDVAGNILTRADTYKYGDERTYFDVKDGYSEGERKNEDENTIKARAAEIDGYTGTYNSLCHKLTTAQITAEEADRTVFENYINQAKLNVLLNLNGGEGFQGYFEYTDYIKDEKGDITRTDKKKVARVNLHSRWGEVHIQKDLPGNNGVTDPDVKIIITVNDVYVERDFDGIIITNGKIHLKPGVTITNTENELSELLRATCVIDGIPSSMKSGEGNTFQLAELFNEDDNWMPVIANAARPEEAELNPLDMITFSNWMRN